MKMRILALSLIFVSGCAFRSPGRFVELRGDVPEILRTNPERIRMLTEFVEKQVGLREPLVATVHFIPCDSTIEKFPELVPAGEATRKQWIESGLPDYNECVGCVGKSYPGALNLWVDSRLWAVERPAKKDRAVWTFWGSGEYTLGHEMFHRALDMLGVPVSEHHCLMLRRGYFSSLAALIGETGWDSDSALAESVRQDLIQECNE